MRMTFDIDRWSYGRIYIYVSIYIFTNSTQLNSLAHPYPYPYPYPSRFIAHRLNLGNKVIGEGYVPIARQYAKFGIPASLRSKIYRTAMGLSAEFTNKERSHYDGLRELVEVKTSEP